MMHKSNGAMLRSCVVRFCVQYEIFLLLKLKSKWNVIVSNKHLISSTKSMVTANY